MAIRRATWLVAWLLAGASASACQHGSPEQDTAQKRAPQTATARLMPARAERAAPEPEPALGAELPGGWGDATPVPARPSSGVDGAVPSALDGIWEVVEVMVDRQDAASRLYQRGDARLVGRSLHIEDRRVRFSFGADLDCRQVEWPWRELTWRALFERGFRRAPQPGRSTQATLSDYGLKANRKQPVRVYSLCPPAGSPPPLDEGQWVLEYHPGELLFREDPQYVLRLTRRPDDAPPRPASFDCSRMRGATQRAICQSHELASWDRSVERALDDFVRGSPEREAQVKPSQTAYLQRRDSCGADADCIEQEQMARVGELIQLAAR